MMMMMITLHRSRRSTRLGGGKGRVESEGGSWGLGHSSKAYLKLVYEVRVRWWVVSSVAGRHECCRHCGTACDSNSLLPHHHPSTAGKD